MLEIERIVGDGLCLGVAMSIQSLGDMPHITVLLID